MGAAASLTGGVLLQPERIMAGSRDLGVPPGTPRARVVLAREPRLVDGPVVHRSLLGEMIDKTLMTLTGKPTVREAWHEFLTPDDVIGLKFNRSGQRVIGTTVTMAEVLISSITSAGWRADQIICIEAPPDVEARAGTQRALAGYESRPTDFGSGRDHFAAVLRQVTAIINVPYLKTHNIAGLTCSLKNLAFGLIKHPARYHGNGCSPYVADIVAAEPIRSRLRLSLVDAMRVVFDRGPEATAETASDEGILIASRDPVATDAVGLGILNQVRNQRGLGDVARSEADVAYLAAAHERGLGIAARHGIDVVRISGP